MNRFLPQHAITLPTPEGFSGLDPFGKVQAIRELRTDPATDPYVLQGVAWDVLGDLFYNGELPHKKLLPEARATIDTIVARKDDLPEDDPNLYLDSRLTLISYDVFRLWQDGELPLENSRIAMARHAGRLLREVAEPVDYDLEALDPRVHRKMLETMVLGMTAFRNAQKDTTTPVVAIPTMHNLQGIDPNTGTSDFSMYLIQPERIVPATINKFTDHHMYDPERHRGTLQISVGPLLFNTSHSFEDLIQERKLAGSVGNGQRWLMSQVARQLANFSQKQEIPRDYSILIDLVARYIGIRAGRYDPDDLNAPPHDRQ